MNVIFKILSATIITLILLTGCVTSTSDNEAKSTIVSDFLANTYSIENLEDKNVITSFEAAATIEADEIITLTSSNIKGILSSSANYKTCVIIVEDHTIVKITDYENCKQSGSWGACMPIVEGYIKRGALELQEDYLNNIIGLPDSKKRTAYLFN